MEFPKPRDDDDARVLGLIKKYGVFIQSVMGDDEGVGFGYSMGLTHNFGHPEVLISGLKHQLHISMINNICARLKSGREPLSHGERISDLLLGVDCIAADMDAAAGHKYLYYAQWLHGTKNVPTMQIIWPSTSGVWPWEADAPLELIEAQEILVDTRKLEDLG